MENFSLLAQGFSTALTFTNIFAALVGAFLGMIIGAMPGIGSLAGCALLLPLTFKMEPTTAIIMLAAIYYANMYGGSFSAILLNIPGDSPAIMTTLDGYPLTKQGKAGKALFTANLASFIGGSIGIVLLTIIGPLVANVGLAFGPAEMVSLLLLALTSIGWLLGENPSKGLVMAGIGILISTIGMDPTTGQARFTFGIIALLSGLNFIPLVIGLFGFSQVMDMMGNKQNFSFLGGTKLTLKESLLEWPEIVRILPTSIRGGLLGNFVGVLPGAGATIASFLSYTLNRRVCKNGKHFGEGMLEGVAASEAANNAAAGGAFAPFLSLDSGIRDCGGASWRCDRGGGITRGPNCYRVSGLCFGGSSLRCTSENIMCVIMAMGRNTFLVHILRVPSSVMAPTITVLCIVGAYSVNNNMFDVGVMLLAGSLAYFFNLHNFSLAPLLLAFVLTPRLEQSFHQAFQISNGNAMIFLTKPISLALLIALALSVTAPLIFKMHRKNKTISGEL